MVLGLKISVHQEATQAVLDENSLRWTSWTVYVQLVLEASSWLLVINAALTSTAWLLLLVGVGMLLTASSQLGL